MIPDRNYALDWYRYGLEKGEHAVTKFMMHWIAFNWIYCEYGRGSERANIRAFCGDRYRELSRYNPFNTDAVLVFMEGPVWDMEGRRGHHHLEEDLYESVKNDYGARRMKSLFLTMYQVRCNLFHGSKSPYNERDLQLVKSSAEILENYLKVCLPIAHPI